MIFFCSVSLCRDDYMQSSPQHGVMWKSAPSLSSIQISYISTDSHSDFPFIRSLLMNRIFSATRTCENERNENYIRWLYCPTRTAFKETLLQYHHDSVWELSAFINEIVFSITVQLLVPFTRSFPFEMFTVIVSMEFYDETETESTDCLFLSMVVPSAYEFSVCPLEVW